MKQILVLLFLIFLVKLASAAVPVPTLSGHVNDYAHVLSDETITRLENTLQQHEQSTSNQIVVLTISSLEGQTIEEKANEIFNTWQLGQKDKNNGVLLLVAIEDRKMRIEVGYGLEASLTDAHSARIIRNELVPYFKQFSYDEGITAGVTAIIGAIQGTYSAEDPGFWETLISYEGIPFPEGLLVGGFVMFILLIFTSIAVFTEGGASWFLFLFLLVFYLTFPFAIFGSIIGFTILTLYVGWFISSKLYFATSAGSAWLRKWSAKRANSGSSRSYSSSSGSSYRSSSSSSRSSYSGGGGRSGGGGSSGSW
ncbi:YgcG family protein [Rhodocytophaga rosea]|uniref:YgcG family protein n=1 Tax=Rhodocytophaga rosea TaxID=2704465 RepID=A0A6C0GNL0_9BACT|nr:TPM domain-containing protein [Rhodocytophaga rosea]QHT69625.1 YgcG family protein [Rhodocytophaga rosea]